MIERAGLDAFAAGFLALVAAELVVPLWAERAAPTSWHPRHIAERYGLFTLIVLGECVLASTLAIQTALDEDAALADAVEKGDLTLAKLEAMTAVCSAVESDVLTPSDW